MDNPQSQSNQSLADLTPSLVVRLRSGEEGAGAYLNELYRDALLRCCWGYLGRMEEAEDAVQDICYKVLVAETIPDGFRPWLYRIARNHCNNLLRDRLRRKDVGELPMPSQVHEELTGQLTHLVKVEEQSQLNDLVAMLPEPDREVLRLRYVEDLQRSEIAEILEVSESVVKSRLYIGLQRLREAAADSAKE
jgi:RNA polymerase sigma factor (sigma-70 family)